MKSWACKSFEDAADGGQKLKFLFSFFFSFFFFFSFEKHLHSKVMFSTWRSGMK